MARTRQKSKQRKAKRLEQQRKAQGTRGQKPPSNPAEQAAVQQAEARELADVLEESGGDPNVAAERLEDEVTDEAVKPIRDEAVEPSRDDAEVAVEEPEPAEAARVGLRERVRRGRAERKPAEREERRPEKRRPEERSRPERKREPRAERKREAHQRGRVASFLVSVWAELKRVQWPNRNQVTQATAVVLVFCLIAGAYLALGDFVFDKVMKAIL
jgi:preprotein translocase SecE subunit